MFDRLIGLFFLDDPSMSSSSSYRSSASALTSNLTVAILAGIGRSEFPKFSIIRTRPVFLTRAHWLAYEAAVILRNTVDIAVTETGQFSLENLQAWRVQCETELGPSIPVVIDLDGEDDNSTGVMPTPLFFLKFTAEYVYMRTLSLVATGLEKKKEYEEANIIYHALLYRDTMCCRSSRGK